MVGLLILLNGIALGSLGFLWMNASYEDRVYRSLAVRATEGLASPQEKALALLSMSHVLVKPRHELLGGTPSSSLRQRLFASGDLALIEGSGACGSYTHVLARLLEVTNIPVRLAQMRCGERWGCHILLEAQVNGRWVVLDPSFALHFTRPDGLLASFSDVQRGWSQYRETVPPDYPQEYRYEEVRYTNWSKIPVIMPALRVFLNALLGERAQFVSIRAMVLNLYSTYFWVVLVFELMLAVVTFRVIRQRGLAAAATGDP